MTIQLDNTKSSNVARENTLSGCMVSIGKAMEEIDGMVLPEPIYPGFYKGTICCVAGPPKANKTMWSEGYAMNAASETITEYNGFPIKNKLKVGIGNVEEPFIMRTIRQKKQLSTFCEIDQKAIKANLYTLPHGFPSYIHTPDLQEDFISMIKEYEFDILIFDSLSHATIGAIEKSEEASHIMRFFKRLVAETGVCLVLVHHVRKVPVNVEITTDMVRGSAVFFQEFDTLIAIQRLSNGIRYVKPLFYRYISSDIDEVACFTISDSCTIEFQGFKPEKELLGLPNVISEPTNAAKIERYIKMKCKATTAELETAFVHTNQMARSTMFDSLKKSDKIESLYKGIWRHKDCTPKLEIEDIEEISTEEE